jgi:hypothetical protein
MGRSKWISRREKRRDRTLPEKPNAYVLSRDQLKDDRGLARSRKWTIFRQAREEGK